MLTDAGDVVEPLEEYLKGARGRSAREREYPYANGKAAAVHEDKTYYRVPHPGILWSGHHGPALPSRGGEKHEITATGKLKAANATSSTSKTRREKAAAGRTS